MQPTQNTERADDPDAPELRYYDILTELDSLTRYVLAVAGAPYAPVIYLDGTEFESRSAWRRWGPDDRRGPGRASLGRRMRGRRADDRVPAYAMC